MIIFSASFYILCLICAALFVYSRIRTPSTKIDGDKEFISFRNTYLVIYVLGMAGDWLQGPYVYALYEFYGMSKRSIEFLFVAGFGASMIVGTLVGGMADKIGRKRNCIVYGILYILSCGTKHFNNFWILLLGRLLGGTATSILWSGFESWLVHEHHSRGYSEEQLEHIFSLAIVGNSLAAIASGLLAQYSVDYFGYVAPFDCAAVVLACMTGIVWWKWTENYGEREAEFKKSFVKSWQLIKTDSKVLCLGLIQSLFEGSMYCFVLEWTPVLTPKAAEGVNDGHAGKIPHGLIFASYMVSMMIGSLSFPYLCNRSRPESFMRWIFCFSLLSFGLPVLKNGDHLIPIVFVGFLVLEFSIGVFWPAIGTMRSRYVPDQIRSTMLNFFRVPLNFLVIVMLTQNLPVRVVFKWCTGFIAVTLVAQFYLNRLTRDLPTSLEIGQVGSADNKADPNSTKNLSPFKSQQGSPKKASDNGVEGEGEV